MLSTFLLRRYKVRLETKGQLWTAVYLWGFSQQFVAAKKWVSPDGALSCLIHLVTLAYKANTVEYSFVLVFGSVVFRTICVRPFDSFNTLHKSLQTDPLWRNWLQWNVYKQTQGPKCGRLRWSFSNSAFRRRTTKMTWLFSTWLNRVCWRATNWEKATETRRHEVARGQSNTCKLRQDWPSGHVFTFLCHNTLTLALFLAP